jgi:hypothetical protein
MVTQQLRSGRFPLGRVLATPGVLLALEEAGQQPQEFLDRHANGDWGEVDSDHAKENDISLQAGLRLTGPQQPCSFPRNIERRPPSTLDSEGGSQQPPPVEKNF